MHIHLDLIGGIAGDMFCASMLDAFPELADDLFSCLSSLNLQDKVDVKLHDASDKGICGKHFSVSLVQDKSSNSPDDEHDHQLHHHDHSDHHHHNDGHPTHHHHHDHSDHHHHSWKEIRSLIQEINVDSEIKKHAIGIFELLAEAESKIHGMDVEDVTFHEVGAWDCIVDILSAAFLIVNSKVTSWSVSDIPWGGGTVKCAHGVIPVPAPATLNLLQGFAVVDDGEKGERVTPTGASILSWLAPSKKLVTGAISRSGYGLGTKKLKTRANVLRVAVISDVSPLNTETLQVIQCDIDDMTGEDLAIAREYIREHPGVLDINEAVSHGKKNRFISTWTLICHPHNLDEIIYEILNHTSTLGVRTWPCERVALKRKSHVVLLDDGKRSVEVKTVLRPNGDITSKVEADCIQEQKLTYLSRRQLKREAEKKAETEFHEYNL